MKKKQPGNTLVRTEFPIKFLLSVLTITVIVFIPSLQNGFVNWDDPEYITKNPYLKEINLSKLFSTVYFSNYHPLTLLSYSVDYIFLGNKPFIFHFTNLLLHLSNTALVFLIIYLLSNRNKWTSALTALLFGIHPMHVESVAWISERKDVLYTFFYLLSLWHYLKYFKKKDVKYLLIPFLFFICSLLSKAQAVTLPLLLLLFDWFFKREFTRKVWLEKIPFFVASIIFGIIAIQSQQKEAAINPNFSSSFQSLFWGIYGLSVYLLKSIAPFNLCGAHPYPFHGNFAIPWQVYMSPLYAGAFTYISYRAWKKNRDYLAGILFFVIVILPVLKFIPVGDVLYAERYSYVSYMGLFYCFSIFITDRYEKTKVLLNKKMILYFVILILSVYAVVSFQRIKTWKDSFVFWNDVAEKYPDYWRGHNCIGQAWFEKGKSSLEKGDVTNAKTYFTNALEKFNRAIVSDPYTPPVPYLWRGAVYAEHLVNYDLAIENFKMAASIGEKNNLKDQSYIEALQSLGLCYQWKGLPRDALFTYNKLEKISATDSRLYFLRGLSYSSLGKTDSAVISYTRAIQLDPKNVKAYLNRGVIFTDQTNQYAAGIRDFEIVLRLEPNNIQAINNLGVAHYKMGNYALAANYYSTSLTINPNQGNVHYLRALVYEQTNDLSKAYQDGLMAQRLGVAVPQDVMRKWEGR